MGKMGNSTGGKGKPRVIRKNVTKFKYWDSKGGNLIGEVNTSKWWNLNIFLKWSK